MDKKICPHCGSDDIIETEGMVTNPNKRFRLECQNCGKKWEE